MNKRSSRSAPCRRRSPWLLVWVAAGTGCQALLGIGDTDVNEPSARDADGGAAGAQGSAATGAAPLPAAGGDPGLAASGSAGVAEDGQPGAGGAAGDSGPSEPRGSGGEPPLPPQDCAESVPNMACYQTATFRVGNSKVAKSWPTHLATVRAFYLDLREVSVAQYESCVGDGACERTASDTHSIAGTELCNSWISGHQDHPINCVRGGDAEKYCQRIGKRLPTEEELEYAMFGGGARAYPWGDKLPDSTRVNMGYGAGPTWGNDGYEWTAPVGSFPAGATPEGVLDLAGNVWEWTASLFCEYEDPPCESCAELERCPNACNRCVTNTRVVRGGSAFEEASATAVDFTLRQRGEYGLSEARVYLGFRCARSVGAP